MKGHATIQCRAAVQGWNPAVGRGEVHPESAYNAALEERRTAWESEQRGVTLYDQMKGLTSQRKDDPEGLGSVAVKAERGMLMRLDRAFKAFFRRKAGEKPGYPRFRPIARMETRQPQSDPGSALGATWPKGFPTIRMSRPLPDGCPLKALRIVRKPPGVCGPDVRRSAVTEMRVFAVDLGVRKRAVLSTGERIERNSAGRGSEQQERSPGARRFPDQTEADRTAISAPSPGIGRNRNACHRLSSRIIREHGLIAVEKLNIQGMVTKGSKKKGLNREILTQSWGLLRNQLQYKAEWAGREFVEVNPAYTSQTATGAAPATIQDGAKPSGAGPADLEWTGTTMPMNILRAGVLALGTGTYLVGESVVPERMPRALRYISGNIFADLGLPDADAHLLKAELVTQIDKIIRERRLKQVDAAKLLGLSQPDVSRLLRGSFREYSMERLLRLLTALGRDVHIVIRESHSERPGRLGVEV